MKYFFRKSTILFQIILLSSSSLAIAQFQLPSFNFTKTTSPDTLKVHKTRELFLDPVLPDVKSIGRGNTSVSGWHGYIGFLHNPSYLAEGRIAFELADAQVILPASTIDAISYLEDHSEDLNDGRFLKQLSTGINNLITAENSQEAQEALDKIDDASAFGDELLTNVIGSQENPTQHGFLAFPNFKLQYKNFGVSLYSVTQASFLVTSGDILNLIRNVHRMGEDEVDTDMLIQLAGLLYDSYQSDNIIDSDALPIIYSAAAQNTALSFSYGRPINDKLSVGGSLHLYRRALSVGIIESANYNELATIITQGLDNPVYDLNLTLGGTYNYNDKISVGMVASNFLPSKKIEGSAEIMTYNSSLEYEIYGDSWLDSVNVDIYSQKMKMEYPYTLSIPFSLAAGITWKPLNGLYLSAEWVDMLANDNVRYRASYAERFRIGAEYSFLREIISLRAGMTHLRPTIGAGVSIPIWNFNIDLDAAYAYTKLTSTAAIYIQLKIRYQSKKKN